MDWISLIVVIALGICVLISYYVILAGYVRESYTKHKFWLGMKKRHIQVLVFFQLLAACGFIISTTTWIVDPPTSGIMGKTSYALPVTLGIFLITAIVWPVATYYKLHWLTVSSLLGTGAASLALLSGSIQEDNQRWWVVFGWVLLSAVTVIGDGIIWNANYIKLLRTNPKYFDKW